MKLKYIVAAAAAVIAAISCSTTPKIEWAPVGDRIITVWGEILTLRMSFPNTRVRRWYVSTG